MTGAMSQPAGRRTVLVALGALALTGCTGSSAPGPAAQSRRPTGPSTRLSTRAPTATPGTGLPHVHRWIPSAADVSPACKLVAVRTVEGLGTSATTAVQVIDAQYGGILADTASVLVVCRSWRITHGRVVMGGHTVDVRLSRGPSATWRVTAIHPSRPGPPAHRSPAARRVLGSDRIDLPPAARADIASGQVHDSVLTAMLGLSRSHRIGVSVVRSGHPIHVFGTNRLSDHPQGRAFDTWRIDGRAVIDPDTPERLVADYMRAVAAEGSYNVGGPYLLGSAPQYFSDATHHDHVHAGFAS